MVNKPQQTDLLMRYLFRELSGAELKRLEKDYFSDDALFVELLAVEDQLIEDFLSEKLTPAERKRFTERYLTIPGKRQKVEFAALARAYGEQNVQTGASQFDPPDKKSWFLTILAFFRSLQPRVWIPVLTVLLVAVGVTFLTTRQKLHPQIATRHDPAAAKSQAQLYSPTPAGGSTQPGNPVLGPPLVSVSLSPIKRTRGAEDDGVKTLQTDAATKAIELKLIVNGETYPLYQGRLQKLDEGAREILRDNSLKPGKEGDDRLVSWKVEAKQLPVGDYQVELQGVKAKGDLGDTSTYGFNLRENEKKR